MDAAAVHGQDAFLAFTSFASPMPMLGAGELSAQLPLRSTAAEARSKALIPAGAGSVAFLGALASFAVLRGQARRRWARRRSRSGSVALCAQATKSADRGGRASKRRTSCSAESESGSMTPPRKADDKRRPRRRATKRRSRTSCSAESGSMTATAEPVQFKGLSVEQVQQSWEAAEALGTSPEDIADRCSWLCCVQRQLGYFAALHEGAVGRGEVVSRAPPLPLILTWEGPEGAETYGMSLADGGGVTSVGSEKASESEVDQNTLLDQLLDCSRQAEDDSRFGKPGNDSSKKMQVRVSLMRGFEDISDSPLDWVPGEHGLWYSTPEMDTSMDAAASCVYLPEVAERLATAPDEVDDDGDDSEFDNVSEMSFSDSDSDFEASSQGSVEPEEDEEDDDEEEEEEYDIEDLKRVLEALVTRGAPAEEGEEDATPVEAGQLPQGGKLYRFASHEGTCSVSQLPIFKTRQVVSSHVRQLLIAQARLQVDENVQDETGELAEFAALTAKNVSVDTEIVDETAAPASSESSIRAFIVPSLGAYSNAHVRFSQRLSNFPDSGLENVKRIFVISPVWDCYVDGCGLPERRCSAYGDIELDMVTLESLRSSGPFIELAVEQDVNERSIEALLPLVKSCLPTGQPYMLVPILVGGLVWQKAEIYTKVLAPYLSDPENLFIISGDVNELGDELDIDRTPSSADTPQRWMTDVPTVSSADDANQLVPVFDALELFLAVLAQVPQGQELRLQRYG